MYFYVRPFYQFSFETAKQMAAGASINEMITKLIVDYKTQIDVLDKKSTNIILWAFFKQVSENWLLNFKSH